MKPLDVFIQGELVDLCIPTKEFAQESDWYAWFNNPNLNRYLEQGMFPNTPDDQVRFYEENNSRRLLLIISNKKDYMGVISLSNINFAKGQAESALVVNGLSDLETAPLISLEAVARITEHAFTTMGLRLIKGGQHSNLRRWQQRLELVGYRIGGIQQRGFVKGADVSDSFQISACLEDYLRLREHRGSLWDSADKMRARIAKLPKRGFDRQLYEFFQSEGESYYKQIFSL